MNLPVVIFFTLKLKENLYLELEDLVQILLSSTILWPCFFYSGNMSKFHVNKLLVTLNSKKSTFYRVIYPLFQLYFQNKYGNRLIRLITKIGFRLLTDNRFQIFSDYTTLHDINFFPCRFPLCSWRLHILNNQHTMKLSSPKTGLWRHCHHVIFL